MKVLSYKHIEKNSLVGSFSLKITQWAGFVISEILVFSKNGERWISLPYRTYEENGEKKYFKFNYFEDPITFKSFQEKALLALDKYLIEKNNTSQKELKEHENVPF